MSAFSVGLTVGDGLWGVGRGIWNRRGREDVRGLRRSPFRVFGRTLLGGVGGSLLAGLCMTCWMFGTFEGDDVASHDLNSWVR